MFACNRIANTPESEIPASLITFHCGQQGQPHQHGIISPITK
ncbi:hypothetical protein SFMTTN_3416 [Sulfuriferula multivorans]|uniref:Uncharacterized protein n=1 Tax=Sulfuriferula multivorans TaxID=1559896 RepID=A0A401K075_9PROT|nr:hypothetical protein SFMTTN_3416 [Sulfuriferula multivorans]